MLGSLGSKEEEQAERQGEDGSRRCEPRELGLGATRKCVDGSAEDPGQTRGAGWCFALRCLTRKGIILEMLVGLVSKVFWTLTRREHHGLCRDFEGTGVRGHHWGKAHSRSPSPPQSSGSCGSSPHFAVAIFSEDPRRDGVSHAAMVRNKDGTLSTMLVCSRHSESTAGLVSLSRLTIQHGPSLSLGGTSRSYQNGCGSARKEGGEPVGKRCNTVSVIVIWHGALRLLPSKFKGSARLSDHHSADLVYYVHYRLGSQG